VSPTGDALDIIRRTHFPRAAGGTLACRSTLLMPEPGVWRRGRLRRRGEAIGSERLGARRAGRLVAPGPGSQLIPGPTGKLGNWETGILGRWSGLQLSRNPEFQFPDMSDARRSGGCQQRAIFVAHLGYGRTRHRDLHSVVKLVGIRFRITCPEANRMLLTSWLWRWTYQLIGSGTGTPSGNLTDDIAYEKA